MAWLSTVAIVAICFTAYAASYVYTKEEEECMVKNQLYHFETKKCYELQSRGPCPERQWFVLRKPLPSDKEDIIKGVCSEDKCGEFQFYWSPEKKCVSKEDKERLCGSSNRVYLGTNDFGEAACICTKTPPHGRLNGDPEKPCVPLYRKGPCKRGEVVGYPTPDAEAPVCMADPCYEESRERKTAGKLPINATLAMYEGKCYELDTIGPCQKEHVFQFNMVRRRFECTGDREYVSKNGGEGGIGFGECFRLSDGTCAGTVMFPPERQREKSDKSGPKKHISEYLQCLRDKRTDCGGIDMGFKIGVGECVRGEDGKCLDVISFTSEKTPRENNDSPSEKLATIKEFLDCLRRREENCKRN